MNEKVKPIQAVDLTGGKLDLKQFEKGDGKLAIQVCQWLANETGNNVALSNTDDGAYILDFAINGVLQPSLKVYAGKVIWPKGSSFDLQMKFLGG